MNLLTIPLRNTWRKPSRTLLLLLIFTIGVMSIVALYQVSQVVGHSLEKKLSAYGANILVSPGTQSLSVSYGEFHLGDMHFDIQPFYEQETIQALKGIELNDRISIIAPKLVSMASIDKVAVAIVGVRWQEELNIKSYWAVDGAYPGNSHDILVGSKAASTMKLNIGDRVDLLGETFTISGVLLETGGDDDTVILMNIEVLQRLSSRPNEVSFIEVAALCSGCPIDDIVNQMKAQLPGAEIKALRNIVNQRMTSINFVKKLVLSISLVILLTATAMVGLSMLSAVNERKKDIGLLRSLGYSKNRIFTIFCFEAGVIGLSAGFLGYLCGFGASIKALELLALDQGPTPEFITSHLLLTCAVISLLTISSAIYPAWKGASMQPSSALTTI